MSNSKTAVSCLEVYSPKRNLSILNSFKGVETSYLFTNVGCYIKVEGNTLSLMNFNMILSSPSNGKLLLLDDRIFSIDEIQAALGERKLPFKLVPCKPLMIRKQEEEYSLSTWTTCDPTSLDEAIKDSDDKGKIHACNYYEMATELSINYELFDPSLVIPPIKDIQFKGLLLFEDKMVYIEETLELSNEKIRKLMRENAFSLKKRKGTPQYLINRANKIKAFSNNFGK